MPWGIVTGAVTGMANFFANQSANERAMMIQQKNFQDWMNLNIPDPAEQKVALQRFVSQGELTPVMQQAIAQAPSEFKNIVTSSQNKAAQNKALSQLSQIGEQGGLRLQDKAALADARMDAITREKSGRAGIADEMARRGLSGSGYDVAARLSGQQGVADRESNAGLKVASDAQDRALQAIMSSGKMATDYRNQDFGEQAQKASAADRINAFNTANLRDVNAANVGAENATNAFNLQNKQRISDQNTSLSNAEQQYNKGLIQQNYENQMKRLEGATGQVKGMAESERKGGENLGNTISNIGGGVANYAAMEDYFNKKQASQNGDGYSAPSNIQSSLNKVKNGYDDDEDPYPSYAGGGYYG